MTQAMLNTKLYQKMFAEQELFKAEMMLLPPVEMLDKAYEYVCWEDILIALEYNNQAGDCTVEISYPTGRCLPQKGRLGEKSPHGKYQECC